MRWGIPYNVSIPFDPSFSSSRESRRDLGSTF